LRKLLISAAALCACAITVEASAQAVSVDRKQVSNAAARKMVDACLAFAEKNNIVVGVAVVGLDGVLLDFHAMQGGGPTVAETAILKAKTAVHWQRSTKTLEQDVTMGRNQASLWINDFPKAGALPIMIDGQVAGAIGVGGAQKQEECAQVGIDAIIPKQPVAAQR
jgi:glc operon protein GlcG